MTDDDREMSDEELADFYKDPSRREARPGAKVIRRKRLSDAIPVRFPTATVEEVKAIADAEGLTVSEWIRRAVDQALEPARSTSSSDDPRSIVDDLRRDLERLSARLG